METGLSKNAQLKIEYRPISSLSRYENNAKTHPKTQIKKIAASIKAFGWTNPLIVDPEGTILCGHGRFEAAISLGMKTVPAITLEHLSEADRKAYIMADNVIAEQAGWSKQTLASELSGLAEIGYELELTGFDTLEIDTLLSLDDPEEPVDDDVELPTDNGEVVCRLGDLWEIGDQRLIVGDARDPNVYERLLGSERVQMVITDPPYGCRIENNVSGNGKVKHEDFVMGAGESSLAEFAMTLLRPAFKCIAAHCASGAIAFVFSDWRAAPHVLDAASGIFYETKQLIVWAKTNGGQGAFYRSAHELIYAFKVSDGTHINNFKLGEGGRYRTNVWTYAGANVFRAGRMQDLADHPTVKPKKMIGDAMLDCSRRGGIVLDAFAGSGTILCAAAATGRLGRAIELDPKYADVTLRRLLEQTGETPMLDGQSFDEVSRCRRELEDSKNG
jgi:DNA modification methylase|tara:strand:- start:14488 stop:15822 length:1335 start_codon:yes stop_codon:yes gene_type:complete